MRRYCLAAMLIALAACSEGDRGYDRSAAVQPPATEEAAPDRTAETPAVAPRIAYTYSYDYRLPAGRIDDAQRAHIAQCDELGPRCRIVTMERANSEGDFASAALVLRVDARIAREIGERLDAAVGEAGGESSGRTIQAEDLSDQIIDVEARIRAKQALADRLMTLIENRAGSVGELVEAERAFAQAQEELDAARTRLEEMQGRIEMSTVTIRYSSAAPQGGVWSPVRDALASAGQMFGWSIAAVITFVVLALPWAFILVLLVWLLRRFGGVRHNLRRLFGRRRPIGAEEPPPTV